MLAKKENNYVIPCGVKRIETLKTVMQEAITRGLMEEYNPPVEHLFCAGMYARRNVVPAGVTVITKVHAREHICIVLYGTCHIYDQDAKRSVVVGPEMFVTRPGTVRAIYCETETSWINVHWSDTDSVEEIESQIFEETFDDYQKRLENLG